MHEESGKKNRAISNNRCQRLICGEPPFTPTLWYVYERTLGKELMTTNLLGRSIFGL